MRLFSIYLFCFFCLTTGCEDLVDNINENPNELTLSDVDAELFLTGAQLANIQVQAGHLNRIAGMYSGQLVGLASLYANIYGYNISTAESEGVWINIYFGVVTNVRHIRSMAPDDRLLSGIAKVLEAHAVGTGASLFGDVPYSEIANPEIDDPKFDSQKSVFSNLIGLLESAIADLDAASSRPLVRDIYFRGNKIKWTEAAYTLIARYYLHLKDYDNAYVAAQNGISSDDGSMKYSPTGDPGRIEGDKNLFWTILEGSRAGDIGTVNSYLMQLLHPDSTSSRNNVKTDETARWKYNTINEKGGTLNKGIVEQFEPQPLVTYNENQLILAECALRRLQFDDALTHLNDYRAWLNTGDFLNSNFTNEHYLYEPYIGEDFQPGGLENPDGLPPGRALLREIIEERYVSGFGMYLPFDDARRLRKTDSDVAVPIPFNLATVTQHPERLPYSDDELNSNSNAPEEDPGIYFVTEVNR